MIQAHLPAAIVLAAWLLFGGSHLLLASSPLREHLVARLGERGFTLAFATLAATTLSLLAATVALHGGDGAAALNLRANPVARWTLAALAALGIALAVAGLANYFRAPIAALRRGGRVRPPAAVELITRHPFFVGLALAMAAHALLATTLAQAMYFAGFVVLALAGIPMQDRKLRRRHGAVWADYEAATPALPFTSGRPPRPAWRELVVPAAGAALVIALHPVWQLGHGAPFALLLAAGGLGASVRQVRASKAAAR